MKKWQNKHKNIIVSFLNFLNKKSEDYILKDATGLMLCYNLDRLSEDIDLDSVNKYEIYDIVDEFTKENGYSYRILKDTYTVKRFMINYGNIKPLKIEISYRRKYINKSSYSTINNFKVYNIDELLVRKLVAYSARDRIRDLYDMAFICNNYWNDISSATKSHIIRSVEYKGIEQFHYIVNTQEDELIDKDKLTLSFLKMYEKLDLLEERLSIKDPFYSESNKNALNESIKQLERGEVVTKTIEELLEIEKE